MVHVQVGQGHDSYPAHLGGSHGGGHVHVGQGHSGYPAHIGGSLGGGHVHVGSGLGGHHHTTYHTHHVHHDPYYTTSYSSDGPFGIMAGGITLLILGVALAALGILGLSFGDVPWGVTALVTGTLGSLSGIAMILFDIWINRIE